MELTKAQRIARDGNVAFFKAVDPRLNGAEDAIPCHKCDKDICYLAIKSRGMHPIIRRNCAVTSVAKRQPPLSASRHG